MSEAKLRSICEKLVAEVNSPAITTSRIPGISDVLKVWTRKLAHITSLIDEIDIELHGEEK